MHFKLSSSLLEEAIVEKKGMRISKLILIFGLLIWSGVESFGQLACNRPLPNDFPKAVGNDWNLVYPMNTWNAFVFQLNPNYNAFADRNQREFLHSTAQRDYKGYLRRNGNPLPNTGLNFDTDFGANPLQSGSVPGGGNFDDANFFPTGNTPATSDGCEVMRSHFGVLMRARYSVPVTGVYRVTVGSDDGTYMRVFNKNPMGNDVLLQDVNGNNVIHNNWVKVPADTLNFDGLYNFLYSDNIRNYYVELIAGQEIYIDLNYYEKNNINRLSFNIELYYGPGEIRLNNVLQTNSETYCAIDPNPVPFFSKGPAVFKDGTLNSYFWEWSLLSNPNGVWNTIAGQTGLTYDIPARSVENWSDTRFYRRRSLGTVLINGFNAQVSTYSNVLQINMTSINFPVGGLNQYGTDRWHGYIYDGLARNQANYFANNTQKYIGKHLVGGANLDFVESFPSPNNKFVPNQAGSCGFFPDYFSVQFLRQLNVLPGTYEFTILADDGYRLFINDILVTNPLLWNRAGGTIGSQSKVEYIVNVPGTIRLRLEYYEIANGQQINFGQTFQALPVEWGQVSGNPCGDSNCLNWETLQEKNTSHFTVERSYDGQEWTPVGDQVEAQGFSTKSTTYQLADASFMRERSFYRVRQVDLDGSMDYSETIRIDNHSFKNKMLPYPNPTVDRVRFYSADEVLMIQVTSHDARINMKANFQEVDQNVYELDFSQLQNSQYVITVVTKDSKESHKIIKR